MPDTRNKRTPKQIEADLVFISECLIHGLGQQQITDKLAEIRPYTLCRQQIASDIKKLEGRWLAAQSENMAAVKSRALRNAEYYRKEAMSAWDKSKKDAVRKSVDEVESDSGDGGTKTTKSVSTEAQCGDIAYLSFASAMDDKVLKLYGVSLNKIELSGPDGGAIPTESSQELDLNKLSREQLIALEGIIATQNENSSPDRS